MEDHRDVASTWVQVDLVAIRGNVQAVLDAGAPDVMAVIKADGYGHGAVAVGRAALAGGASRLGVARADEALELRAAGLDAPILLLGHVPPATIGALIEAAVDLTLWTDEQIAAVAAVARERGLIAGVHLKIDTGMTRLGCHPQDAADLARAVRAAAGLRLEGVFTHLARADETTGDGAATTARQLDAFETALTALDDAGLRPALVHAANSAGALAVPRSRYDMVRLGIAMYGLSPGPQVRLPEAVRPALTWRSVLARVEDVPPGRGVSYGHLHHTTAVQRIGTVPVGYADGWRRVAGNEVLVAGVRVPVLGRVCMDQCMVDLDRVPGAAVGDEVVLIGSQGTERISGDDVGGRWGTIGYEVVCGIGRRVPRFHTPWTDAPMHTSG